MIRNFFSGLMGFLVIALCADTMFGQEHSPLDKDLDRIWGKEREVRVIQKRVFEKEGRFEFTPYFGMIPNDEFFNYYPIGLRAGYFFSEMLGAEIGGAWVFSQSTDLKTFIKENFGGVAKISTPQWVQWYAGANGIFAPIHGKFAFLARTIAHFDLALLFGVGAIGTKVQAMGAPEKSKVDVYGNIGAGFHIYIHELLGIRIDYRHFFYAAEGGGVSWPAEISLGLGVFTKAPQ